MSKMIANLVVAGACAAAGGALALASTLKDERTFLLRAVPSSGTGNVEEHMDGKEFHEAELVRHSYKDLLRGTKAYNNGNYVIYYGSEACPHCTGFLFGHQDLARGNLWLARDKMSDGAFMKAYGYTRKNDFLKKFNIKFLMYEDVPEYHGSNVNDDLWTLPWSRWDTTDLKKGRVKGEYKRNDKSAREFRKVMDAAIEVFGGDKAGGTPTAIIYKNGKGKVFNHDQLEGLHTRKQEEDLSDDIELKNYIHYYYSHNL
ncbi:hypothetical protein MHF_0759 [Mycoplasma haemofelis Ohio2]|uniref:Uncharacterized protein n=1 Tax=Mycoplasma haemofelis (strain Ohio2) TaxID=859194 RepID=F6FII0_MYCHI|nr:hypothetical protein MHF_0759 [Mycoplasma haemofelis Ohio2]